MPASGDGYTSEGERVVGRLLEAGLGETDRLWANQRVTDDRKNAEVDFLLALPEAGFVVLEVKGGQVTYDGEQWRQTSRNGNRQRVDPIRQARQGMYGLRTYVEADPRWGSRGRVRWAHAVVFPFTAIPDDFAVPECPRYMAFGRDDLDGLVGSLTGIALRQEGGCRVPSYDDVDVVAEILRGRGFPQADVIGRAAERDALADHLTEQQGMLLAVSKLIRRMEIRGGAGSGKTWLALEQARRLQRSGERVALVCYSRGLAAYFKRVTGEWPRREQPAYVGTFHGLGTDYWGGWRRRRTGTPTASTGRSGCLGRWSRLRAPSLRGSVSTPSSSTRRRTSPTCGGRRFSPHSETRRRGGCRCSATRGSGCSPGSVVCRSARRCSCSSTTCATPARSPTRSSPWP